MLGQGKSYEEVALKFGVTAQAVRTWERNASLGIAPRKPGRPRKEKAPLDQSGASTNPEADHQSIAADCADDTASPTAEPSAA